jgi:hypothetical protein
LLGKLSITKVDEEIDETSDIGKKKSMIIKLNEIAYTELILLIEVKASIIRWYKTKDYPDGKNKYEPVSAPSMVKLEKQFRELTLKKGQDPEVWITELEDLCIKLEKMGSLIKYCFELSKFVAGMNRNRQSNTLRYCPWLDV